MVYNGTDIEFKTIQYKYRFWNGMEMSVNQLTDDMLFLMKGVSNGKCMECD